MAIKKVATGWQADFHPAGRFGPRVRKTFRLKRDAEAFEITEKAKARNEPEYTTPTRDNRRLSDLAMQWYDLCGHELESGKKRLLALQAVSRNLGDPLARSADPRDFLNYRRQRVEAGVSANHLNHELVYLKTMFNKLIKLGEWKLKNPYANVDPLKFSARVMSYLTLEQIEQLLIALDDSVNPDVKVLAKLCLTTGCRWGEAQGVERPHVHHGKVMFVDTKNGENRTVPVPDELIEEMLTGRPAKGPLFLPAADALENGLARAGIVLERGQKTHVLRHTFASHFMMQGGDILVLNKILGHKTLEMTMKYAHLSPKHLEMALEKNPLAVLAAKGRK